VAVANGTYSFRFGSGGSVPVTASETVATTNGTHQVFSGAIQGTPQGGGITLSDGTYSWTSVGGSSDPAAFWVTYNATLRSFQIVYLSQLPPPGRAIVASFQRLEAQNSIEAALANPEAHLALVVNSVEETKRSRLLAVPYALRAKSSQSSADAQAILNGSISLPASSVGSAQLLSNSIQSRHLAEGIVDSNSMAVGAVSGHQVVSGNITAEPNKTYFVNTGQESGTVFLPQNPRVGDVVRVVGEGALVRAPEGVAILHGWTHRKIETSTENASSIYGIVSSDDANTIYAHISARLKDEGMYERPTFAVSRDGAKTWTFVENLIENNSSGALFIHGCSSNGSRLLYSVDSSLKVLEDFGNSKINIASPDGVSLFDFVRLTPDGRRIVGYSSSAGSIYITDNLGHNWRKCSMFAHDEEIQFNAQGYISPFHTSANGSVILSLARRVADPTEVLVFSEDSGSSWRILQLPWINELGVYFPSLKTSLSRDGTRIFIFNELQTPANERARLVSNDKGTNWSVDRINYDPNDGSVENLGVDVYAQLLQSASSARFYFGRITSIDSGVTWSPLPKIFDGTTSGFYPTTYAISYSGAKVLAGNGDMGGSNAMIFTSWREEIRCDSSLEFYYVGDAVWNVIPN
jgi:hypothetical protein